MTCGDKICIIVNGKGIMESENSKLLGVTINIVILILMEMVNITKPCKLCSFHFSFISAEECKCSCNDVIWAVVVGSLVFIIIGLILFNVWLHKRGK